MPVQRVCAVPACLLFLREDGVRRRSVLGMGLRLAALATGAAAMPRAQAAGLGLVSQSSEDAARGPVKRVLLVTKCHLDVGFTATQALVMRRYFDVYYPQAMKTAAALREAGGDRYTWTTGSWLLYEYLEQASAAERAAMEAAIAKGDIAWHALPFSWQTEMLDASMITGALGFSQSLDARFGKKTIGAKMTDVPGHTRGIIAPLEAAGVRLLDVGVNAASTPPEVPDIFLWKDPAGRSLVMVYHRHDYGSVVRVPGSDVAIAVEVRNDNSGPHTMDEIAAIYAKLRAQFAGARIEAASLSEVAAAVEPYRERLPVVTGEIGDTWIYGIPSDPPKVARYREMARLRRSWIEQRRLVAGDAVDRQMLRRLALAVEHTWGTDTKSYIDKEHYRPADLAKVLAEPGYRTMQVSWEEKRDDIAQGIAALPDAMRAEANTRMATLAVRAPDDAGMRPIDAAKEIQTKHFTLAVDGKTGAIVTLENRATKKQWASAVHPLALFTYQTLSAAEYADFLERYVVSKADWAPQDFGKPKIEAFHAEAREWHPTLVSLSHATTSMEERLLLRMKVDDAAAEATGNTAWPREIYLEARLPASEPVVHLRLTTMGKAVNRMPEAMWLTFKPMGNAKDGWSVEKVGQDVAVADVIEGGGRAMHAVSERVRYQDAGGGEAFELATIDAPVVALGARSPLNYAKTLPEMSGGVHVSLFNNAWGTNYPQWCGGDWSYRFTLRA